MDERTIEQRMDEIARVLNGPVAERIARKIAIVLVLAAAMFLTVQISIANLTSH